MKNICLLGATGSIGTSALDIIKSNKDLGLYSFSYHSNETRAKEIMREFSPAEMVQTDDLYEDSANDLVSLAEHPAVDTVLAATMGTVGIRSVIAALKSGKTVALANKETLVAAGDLVMATVKESIKNSAKNINEVDEVRIPLIRKRADTSKLIPVDSEHSAIYQCLGGKLHSENLKSIVITASGGAFRDLSYDEIKTKKAKDALKHPRWNMGKKISIDSATMMNKGLEVIEAMHLFGLSLEQIEVLIHPESVIHSMVRFEDGSVLAELSEPDMRQPISYALTGKKQAQLQHLDFTKYGALHFREMDSERFPCFALAMDAARAGGVIPAVLSTANDVAVEAYLEERIGFYDIARVVRKTMDSTTNARVTSLEQIEEIIQKTEQKAREYL